MQTVAAGWLVLNSTGSATKTGLVVGLQALPALVVGPIVGRRADRGERESRRVLVRTQALLAVSATAGSIGAWLYLHERLSAIALSYVLMSLAFSNGTLHAIEGPHLGRFSLQLIGSREIPAALSLGALFSSAGRIVGTASAGLLALVGVPLIFLINALTFVGVAVTLRSLRPVHSIAPSRQGWGSVGSRIWVLLALSAVLGGLGRNYQVTLAALSVQRGFGASGFAALSSLFAVGAVVGGAVAVWVRNRTVRLLLLVAVLASLLQAAVGVVSPFSALAGVVVVVAVSAVLIDILLSTIVQTQSHDGLRGRVIAMQAAAGAFGAVVGAPFLGYLSEHYSPSTALIFGSVVCLIATLLVAPFVLTLDGPRHLLALTPLRCSNWITWMKQRRHNLVQSHQVRPLVPLERSLQNEQHDLLKRLPESVESRQVPALQH